VVTEFVTSSYSALLLTVRDKTYVIGRSREIKLCTPRACMIRWWFDVGLMKLSQVKMSPAGVDSSDLESGEIASHGNGSCDVFNEAPDLDQPVSSYRIFHSLFRLPV
jgi:hypothetical protein